MALKPKQLACAVLFSGVGTTTRALLDYAARPQSPYRIDLLVTNNPDAPGVALAAYYGVELLLLPDRPQGRFMPRELWDAQLGTELATRKPDLLLLAGFMRLLGAQLVQQWQDKILNIHPSLLPKYPGLDTHRRVLEQKDDEHGFSIHLVTPELDAGPLLWQERLRVEATDTPDKLKHRVQQLERHFYPRVVELIALGELQLSSSGTKLREKQLFTTGTL